MPRKQVLASPEDVGALLTAWAKQDRLVTRQREQWRTQMNREAKATVRSVRGNPMAATIVAAVRSNAIQKEMEWVQTDLSIDLERVQTLRQIGAGSEHVLAYERRIAARRIHLSRLMAEVA